MMKIESEAISLEFLARLNAAVDAAMEERYALALARLDALLADTTDPLLRALALFNRGHILLDENDAGAAGKAARAFSASAAEFERAGANPTCAREAACAARSRVEAINRLVVENRGLIWKVLHTWPSLWRGRLDEDDAMQDGYLGLLRAAETYDPEKGKFSTHAIWWIRQRIRRGAREARLISVPHHQWDAYTRIRMALGKCDALDAPLSDVADQTGLAEPQVRDLLALFSEQFVSTETPALTEAREDGDPTVGDQLEAPPVPVDDQLDVRALVTSLLARLLPDERQIIALRYHLVDVPQEALRTPGDQRDEEAFPRPMAYVARIVRMTRARAANKETHAFLKLRYWAEQFSREPGSQESGIGWTMHAVKQPAPKRAESNQLAVRPEREGDL